MTLMVGLELEGCWRTSQRVVKVCGLAACGTEFRVTLHRRELRAVFSNCSLLGAST
jgi:hypothetical protein